MIQHLTIYTLLWVLLSGANLDNWPLGVLFILLATGISTASGARLSWSITGFINFLPFFLWHSVKGGLDVAKRTFRPSLPLAPDLITYELRLSAEPARLFFANTINLLPGTLCTDIQGTRLNVHVLDGTSGFREELESLEHKVARLFKLSLAPHSGA